MKILTVNTGLFPDSETVEAAMSKMGPDNDVQHIDLPKDNEDTSAWDTALTAILAADMIITT